jgi:GT2 family glycosyltransferase
MFEQQKTSRIAVLMTCHNRRETTLSCLEALYEQELPENFFLEVYLVDDGSIDGTGEAVREKYSNIHVLQGDGSLYWCGGMRFAWTVAMKENYDAYLWLNDDTKLLPGAIKTILATKREVRLKKGRYGIIVGSCRDPETGKHTYGGRLKRNRYSRIADQPLLPDKRILPCDTMNGNIVLIPAEVCGKLGNLSPEFTHALGDIDYGMRACRAGVPIWIAPGYLGECKHNSKIRPWTNPEVSLTERWKNLCSPLGLPPRQWYVYTKRHFGWVWPFHFIKPLIRVLFPSPWTWKNR